MHGRSCRKHCCTSLYVRSGRVKRGGGQHEQCLGPSRGGFRNKIHLLVDALGFPRKFILNGGERHDMSQAELLLALSI